MAAILASVLLFGGCAGGSALSPQPSATSSPTMTAAMPSATPTTQPSPPAAGIELARSTAARMAVDPARAGAAAAAMNAFGLELYSRIAAQPGNIVISPASVAIALSMARAGARGTTADQMDAVLRDLGSDQLGDAINALDLALAARSGTFKDSGGVDQPVALHIANALFAQYDMGLQAAFLDAMASRYGAGLWTVDFKSDPELARTLINAWVSDKTETRIPEILKPGQITAATRLAIANAIYLKAAWLNPFDKDATVPGAFTLSSGSSIQVPTMHLVGLLPYAAGPGWQAVQLPYVGEELAMTVIVPNDLAAFERSLTADELGRIVSSMKVTNVDLAMPKFDTGSTAELSDLLAALGMPDAFDGALADFSGITAEEALHIGFVIHQANITVDEAGTEAAAATVIGMDTAGPGATPVTVHVDHPFLFALRDVPTGAVVFIGRVADPTSKG